MRSAEIRQGICDVLGTFGVTAIGFKIESECQSVG
jgi:hypothetical protein